MKEHNLVDEFCYECDPYSENQRFLIDGTDWEDNGLTKIVEMSNEIY